ncbi:MAG TPA: hypothetical protein VEW48_23295 [Thermoanaerobaculia bacterium]|nr:hypothetical protein [Thermoanaerobaculia bacterium]
MTDKKEKKPGEEKEVFEQPKMVDLAGKEITREELPDEELEGASGGLMVEQTCNVVSFEIHHCNVGTSTFEEA